MRIGDTDAVIGLDVAKENSSLFVITSKGFGKNMLFKNIANKGRGGKGMTYLKVTEKVGHAIEIRSVFPDDEIIIASKSGMTIRLLAKDVSVQGRTASGVRLLNIGDDDMVSDVAAITEEK